MTREEQIEFDRRRRSRNLALGLVLLGFAVLFFFVTIVRIGGAR